MVQVEKSTVNPRAPLVVKLGGSLHQEVPVIIPILCNSDRPLLVVPGGGLFADAVRQVKVDDDRAHWMAIAAMDQYGWFVASHGMRTTDSLSVPEKTTVFLPYISMRQQDPLPHSWEITSDTIAAWVADQLGLELLLLKSVDGIIYEGRLQERVTTPIQSDVVDPFFIPYVLKNEVKTTIINGNSSDNMKNFLKGEPITGTRIGQPFKSSKRDTIGIVGGAIMSDKKCTSCSAPLAEEGATKFGCPACGYEVNRCYRCREQSIPYTCPKCGFGGP